MSERRHCKWKKCDEPIPVTARADAEFCCPEHKSAHHNEGRRSQGATVKRLIPGSGAESERSGEVRLLSEAASDGELAERFRPLIRTAIFDRLRTAGECHADDLADVYPEGHVDLCRHLASAHFGQLARGKVIEKVEWRKSTAPGRNGGGSWVWRLTKAGWDQHGIVGSSPGARHACPAGGGAAANAPARAASDDAAPGAAALPAPGASPDQLQRGRDRQARGAGSGEDGIGPGDKSAGSSNSPRRNTQPARLSEDSCEPLTLLPDEAGLSSSSAFTQRPEAA